MLSIAVTRDHSDTAQDHIDQTAAAAADSTGFDYMQSSDDVVDTATAANTALSSTAECVLSPSSRGSHDCLNARNEVTLLGSGADNDLSSNTNLPCGVGVGGASGDQHCLLDTPPPSPPAIYDPHHTPAAIDNSSDDDDDDGFGASSFSRLKPVYHACRATPISLDIPPDDICSEDELLGRIDYQSFDLDDLPPPPDDLLSRSFENHLSDNSQLSHLPSLMGFGSDPPGLRNPFCDDGANTSHIDAIRPLEVSSNQCTGLTVAAPVSLSSAQNGSDDVIGKCVPNDEMSSAIDVSPTACISSPNCCHFSDVPQQQGLRGEQTQPQTKTSTQTATVRQELLPASKTVHKTVEPSSLIFDNCQTDTEQSLTLEGARQCNGNTAANDSHSVVLPQPQEQSQNADAAAARLAADRTHPQLARSVPDHADTQQQTTSTSASDTVTLRDHTDSSEPGGGGGGGGGDTLSAAAAAAAAVVPPDVAAIDRQAIDAALQTFTIKPEDNKILAAIKKQQKQKKPRGKRRRKEFDDSFYSQDSEVCYDSPIDIDISDTTAAVAACTNAVAGRNNNASAM